MRAVSNPGGMERVLLNKASFLVREKGWEVVIVTTDQKGQPPFYPFPKEIRMIDLGINYADDNEKNVLLKIGGYLKRRHKHRHRLSVLLNEERADLVVSLFPSESSFIPDIKDGSKKVLELHFCKFFRLQYGRCGLLGLIDRLRTKQDEKLARRFDKFVVLTEEDRSYWGEMPNITVIPNAAMPTGGAMADGLAKRVIAVGRLDYQKGFDRLLRAWLLVQRDPVFREWRLDIFGQGEWQERLQGMIDEAGLNHNTKINQPTNLIAKEYAGSSVLVMSSHYEGFPMVMIEAMAAGLPVVTFDYKCGPRDIIRDGVNGLMVPNGDIDALAAAMKRVMGDEAFRRQMSLHAREVVNTYSEQSVMRKWVTLFEELAARPSSTDRVPDNE